MFKYVLTRQYWINDFAKVRYALRYTRLFKGKEVPLWFAIPYYVIVLLLVIPLAPLVWIWMWWETRRILRELKKWGDNL